MILHLFNKPDRYKPMVPVSALQLSPGGIAGAVEAPPIRQILILPQSTIDSFGLQPGDLRENVVIDDNHIGGLHQLPSGSVVTLGKAQIRLTVHCEPCPRVKEFVTPFTRITGQRGYLGTCLNEATIRVGQPVETLGLQFEPIPFDLKDRAAWYLEKLTSPIPVTDFVRAIGLSMAYCRAVPTLIRDITGGSEKILFKNRATGRTS